MELKSTEDAIIRTVYWNFKVNNNQAISLPEIEIPELFNSRKTCSTYTCIHPSVTGVGIAPANGLVLAQYQVITSTIPDQLLITNIEANISETWIKLHGE